MAEPLDLAQLQRKAYLSYNEDGLAEVFAGALVVSISAWLLLDRGPWAAVTPALLLVLLAGLRRQVRYPRVGYMRLAAPLAPRRRRQALSVLLVLLALGVLLWLMLGGAALPAVPPSTMQLALGLAASLVLACTGLYTGLARWFSYAVLVAVATAVTPVLGFAAAYGLLAGGVLVLLWGLALLLRFMRKYPVLNDDVHLGGNNAGGAQ